MTERAWGIIAAAAGTALVTLLMLRGVDLARASATGPRWRRRLVAAGIAALAASGVQAETYEPPPMVTCYDPAYIALPQGQGSVASLWVQFDLLDAQLKAGTVNSDTAQIALRTMEGELEKLANPEVFSTIPEDEQNDAHRAIGEAQVLLKQVQATLNAVRVTLREQALADNSEWCSYLDVYAELKMIAANERGSYPFDAAGKQALMAQAAAALAALDGLARGGLLTQPETELLKKDLAELQDRVQAYRPTEMQLATCYAPMPPRNPAEQGMIRVNDRIDLLRQLAEQQVISQSAILPVIDALRVDIAALNAPANLQRLPEGQRAAAEQSRAAAEQALTQIERKLAAE